MSFLTVKRAFIVRVPTNSQPSKVICRICRKQCTTRDQVPLFKNTTLRANASMLALIADVKIIPNDGLPTVICMTCNNILEKAYVLRTVAQNSDKLFRKHLMGKKLSVPTKKVLNQKTPNKQNIQATTPDDKTKLSKIDDNNEDHIINIFKQEPTELESTSNDIFSDMNDTMNMNDTNDIKCNVKDTIEFEDDGFLQAEADSDPDYTPDQEEIEDDENRPQKVTKEKKVPTFSSKVTVRPRVSMAPRGGVKPIQKISASEVRQFLQLRKQHAFKEKIQLKIEAERRMRARLERKMKAKGSRSKEGSSGTPTLCSICGTLAKNINAHLKQHMEKTLKCTQCTKSYKTQSHLNAHMKKHLGQRDYKCDLCGAAFYEKKGVVRHMLMHTQTRPYPCKICGKSFSYSNVLRNHMDIHLNRKPHSCEICERPFRTKKHLKTHMIIHTGERPFSCEICDLHFAYKVNLNQHMARSHMANWKYKSIPIVTEEILDQEQAKDALKAILPYVQNAQHEIVVTTSDPTKDDMDSE